MSMIDQGSSQIITAHLGGEGSMVFETGNSSFYYFPISLALGSPGKGGSIACSTLDFLCTWIFKTNMNLSEGRRQDVELPFAVSTIRELCSPSSVGIFLM